MRVHPAYAITVLALVLAAPAAAANTRGPVAGGIRLECSLQQGGDVTIANRSQTDIAAGTSIELASNSGDRITVLAPRKIPVKGRQNFRATGLTGDSCTAQTGMMLSQ